MSYSSKELSVQDSIPVWLVRFVQGSTTYQYNTCTETLTRLSSSWFAAALILGDIEVTGEIPKSTLSIKLPYNNPLASTFVGYSPDVVTTVTVWRTHYDDTDVLVCWKGRVLSSVVDGRVVTLNCEPVFTSLKRKGLRRVYQRRCPFAFFERGCNVAPATYKHTLTVTAVAGAVVTATGAGSYVLKGGTLQAPDGTIRMIIKQVADVLTLMRPIQSLAVEMAEHPGGFSVDTFEGCNHDRVACAAKSNLGNYGGFEGIPDSNPMANPINMRGS